MGLRLGLGVGVGGVEGLLLLLLLLLRWWVRLSRGEGWRSWEEGLLSVSERRVDGGKEKEELDWMLRENEGDTKED